MAIGLRLPDELPSPQVALKMMAEAIEALSKPGMTQEEVRQWRSTAQVFQAYDRMFKEFVKCKRVEVKLLERALEYQALERSVREKGRRAADLWPRLNREDATREPIEVGSVGVRK